MQLRLIQAQQQCTTHYGRGHPLTIELTSRAAKALESIGRPQKAKEVRKGRWATVGIPNIDQHVAGVSSSAMQVQCVNCRMIELVGVCVKFHKCSKCLIARYCSHECQKPKSQAHIARGRKQRHQCVANPCRSPLLPYSPSATTCGRSARQR